jgi:hypothetical protein
MELAETGERYGVARLKRSGDDIEECVHGFSRVALAEAGLAGHGVHELLLGHCVSSWSSWDV